MSPNSARSRKSFAGFAVLHAGNTALNMGFTLVQLLVLARLLPLARYSEIVFLATIGFYFQPFDQAFGKTNFLALRDDVVRTGRIRTRPELKAALAGQALALLAAALIVPSLLTRVGTQPWLEDVLFLSLGLSINFWAFDLQSTAWAIDRNMPFVKLSIVHRTCHLLALASAFATGSFLVFVILASLATAICVIVVARMFARAGLFADAGVAADWPSYLAMFRTAFLATLSDFVVLNAPYGLVAARFGIGPMLVVFDSVMKVARIVMAGSRTLAEVALPRHSGFVAENAMGKARSLFWTVMVFSLGASLIPAATVLGAGQTVFHVLLGRDDVIPPAAIPGAALIIMASGLYQPAVFFLSFGSRSQPVQVLTGIALVVIAAFGLCLYALPMRPASMLMLFGLSFLTIGCAAAWLTDNLFRPLVSLVIEPDIILTDPTT